VTVIENISSPWMRLELFVFLFWDNRDNRSTRRFFVCFFLFVNRSLLMENSFWTNQLVTFLANLSSLWHYQIFKLVGIKWFKIEFYVSRCFMLKCYWKLKNKICIIILKLVKYDKKINVCNIKLYSHGAYISVV
jgi:hypothetical protein